MNKGKICVSVCAETADELIEQIKRAEDLADVVEIRFDCLKKDEGNSALSKISNFKFQKKVLATLRLENVSAEWFFGSIGDEYIEIARKRISAYRKRIRLWKKILSLENLDYLDFEIDLFIGSMMTDIFDDEVFQNHEIIFSHHDFSKTPQNLAGIYKNFSYAKDFNIKCDVVKIAVQADDVTDTIPIWKLLEQAKDEKIIPIAMGEAGKWTRILGLAHGAFMTYAALDSGKETAPGQVSAKDLIDIYRAKELDENTEVYGIIGSPVWQSVSPYMQNAAFKFHDLNAVYLPFEVANLDEFIKRFVREETREVEINLKGFSVTIPHKQAILKHIDFIDEDAENIGAVNTLKIVDGKIYGYNTDAHGFIVPLKNAYGDLSNAKVAVIGNGGAARACVYALKKELAEVTIFARNPEKAESLANEFEVNLTELNKNRFDDFDVLINTTPLGMKGKLENETPVFAEQMDGLNLVYDLVYNPFETRFLKEADKANVPKIGGLAMLVAQGIRQFEIWVGRDAPPEEMSAAALRKLK